MYLKYFIALFFGLFLAGCTGNWTASTPDEIFDATSGVSNHANDPDSNL